MGEDLAVEFLKKYGYQIVCRNFYCRFGEVDIIATDTGDQLIFLEVKTRRGNAFGPPETSVDWRKQRKIRHAAMYFLSSKGAQYGDNYRFDIIALVFLSAGRVKIRHLKSV